MKNIAIILLSIVFVASAIAGVIFYRQSNVKDQELTDAKENLLSLKRSEQDLKTQLQNKDDFIGDLQSQLETSQAQILSLQDQTKQLMSLEDCKEINIKEINNANQRIVQLESEINLKGQELEDANEDLLSLKQSEQDLNNANQRIVQLESEINLKDQELADANEDLLSLKQSEQDLKTRLQQKDDSFGKLQSRLETLHAQILSLQGQTEQKKTELMGLKKQFQNVWEEKDSVEIKIEEIKSTYNALVNKLQENINNQEAIIKEFEKKLSVTFIDSVLFGFGKASITPEGKKILKNVGDILKNLEARKIRVIGHTDNIPISSKYQSKFPTNWELSSARAAAVIRFFQNESGLDPENMECAGRSYYQPVTSNKTSVGRAKNRRVEIIIVPIKKKVAFENQ
jgi:chemotaxis protein MotB